MFACDVFDMLALNLPAADLSCLKNKRSMVICLKKVQRK